ncbi:MAG: TetR/AcrR family transcriptional regulator [bacterium]
MNTTTPKVVADRGGRATREKILAAADAVLADRDSGDLTLKQIAARLDLHYTAVYHYFKNRDELESELVVRYAQRRSENLAEARRLHQSIPLQLAKYIDLDMHEPSSPLLRARATLAEPYRERVIKAYQNSRFELELLLKTGMQQGSLRKLDSSLAAHLVVRVLDRFTNAEDRQFSQAGLELQSLSDELVAFLQHGILAPEVEAPGFMCRPPYEFVGLGQSKLDELLCAATAAFNRRGWRGTSIPQVARDLGISKTKFYRFAASKEELLFLCALRTVNLIAQVRQAARAATNNPLQALLLDTHYLRQLLVQAPGPLLSPYLFDWLSAERFRVVDEIYQSLRMDLVDLLKRCVDAGYVRPLSALAVQPMITACGFLPIQSSDDTMYDQVVDIVLKGLSRS